MNRWRVRSGLVCLLLAIAADGAVAQGAPGALHLARIFSDGMVIQRDARIPVWGWAAPGTRVTARLRGGSAQGIADSSGRWSVTLPASSAGGPYALTVSAGTERVVVTNVLVGDVWVASGQSNMEFSLSVANDAAAEIAAAHDSSIREFKVPNSWAERPASEDVVGGSWAPADPEHVGAFSAVAYFFARELRRTQHVPIGIVNVTWGGSAIETWMSARTQGRSEDAAAEQIARERARGDSVREAMRARFGNVDDDQGLVNGVAVWAASSSDSGWASIRVPALWESVGYADLDGVAWYRTTITLSADEASHDAQLSLGPVDDDDITWVNGVEVGRTGGWNVPRSYRVPASALHAGANVIAVRVTDGGGGGGIYGAPEQLHLDVNGTTHALVGEWKFRVGEVGPLAMDGQRVNKIPAVVYNRMVYPLLPIAIKGVIWYQGESNAENERQARAYRGQFQQLVTSWRHQWNGGREPSFPFLWVQLPNYMHPDSTPAASGGAWAIQRESMAAALALPGTGQAITIDIGGENELHPKDKLDVGKRLALVARKVAYGEKMLASGPTYRSHVVRGGKMIVRFANVGGGLVSRAKDGSVGAFAIAGADRRFVWARARIEGDHVVVWSDQVPHPVAVRYAWANNPADANLYNREGLPAAPFRTDRW